MLVDERLQSATNQITLAEVELIRPGLITMNHRLSLFLVAVVIAGLTSPLCARTHSELSLVEVASDVGCLVEVRLRFRQQTSPAKQSGDWASWRGPIGSGEAFGSPPIEWGETKNIKWKTAIPGLGCSTPIAWKDRIYLTTAVAADAGDGDKAERGALDFRVLCIRRSDGEVVWSKSVIKTVPHESVHATASQASNSPVTDGQRIYAHFGSRGIYCLDMSGKVVWSKQLGKMTIKHKFGEGSSPALAGDVLIVNWDHDGGSSFICALNKKSGKQIWRKEREEGATWATPAITKVRGKTIAIVPASGKSCAYNVKNGKVIWSVSGLSSNVIPSPIVSEDVTYLMSGYKGTVLQAIKLMGAKGDLDDSKNILWTHKRQTSYVPSALLYGGYIYFLRNTNAVLSCLDIRTGSPAYEGQRIAGLRTIYASPVAANEHVYLLSRQGVAKVIKAGGTYEEVASNRLDDQFDASPIIIGDELYLRGHRSLYCIREMP